MWKMLAKTLLFVLPVIVYGIKSGIHIDIVVSDSPKVSFSGRITEIIPDEERTAWRLSDDQLKGHFLDETLEDDPPADNVFVKSPTSGNDPYTTYGWPQVKRTLVPTRYRIKNIIAADPQLVYTYNINNNSTATSYDSPAFFYKVVQTVSSTWSFFLSEELQIGPLISHSVIMHSNDGSDGSGLVSNIYYNSKWGDDTKQAKTITIKPKHSFSVPVMPGEDFERRITLNNKIVEIEVDYTATLEGNVVAYYREQHMGRHFLTHNISDLVAAKKLPYSINSTEILRIVFYPFMMLAINDPRQNYEYVNLKLTED